MKPLEIIEVREFDSVPLLDSRYRTYQIFFVLPHNHTIAIGKLGRFTFPAGSYVYTGSAKRNIRHRISRHLSVKKKLRWHIDYLLSESGTLISKIKLFDNEECNMNKEIVGEIIVPGFGAADCKFNCSSHLKIVKRAD